MCVLPARSVAQALPTELANLVVIAAEIEADDDTQQQQQQQPSCAPAKGRGNSSKRGGRRGAYEPADMCSQFAGSEAFGALRHVATSSSSSSSDDDDLESDEVAADDDDLGSDESSLVTDVMELAAKLAPAFPNDVGPLVDLTGEPGGRGGQGGEGGRQRGGALGGGVRDGAWGKGAEEGGGEGRDLRGTLLIGV